jgi:hypothetical protein
MIYKFTLVWQSMKQDTKHRPSHHIWHPFSGPKTNQDGSGVWWILHSSVGYGGF